MNGIITGSQLRQARTLAGLTLQDAAYLAGTVRSNVHRLEAFGDKPIPPPRKRGRAIMNSLIRVLELNGAALADGGVRAIPKEFPRGDRSHEESGVQENGKEHPTHTRA